MTTAGRKAVALGGYWLVFASFAVFLAIAYGLPYCSTPTTIDAILKKAGVTRAGGRGKRAVSQLTWPYNCVHASILRYQNQRQFIQPIYTCCTSCNPAFSICVNSHISYAAKSYICPSDGFQCIVSCVKKHDPNPAITGGGGGGGTWWRRRTSRVSRRSRRFRRLRYRKRPTVNNKCEKKVISNGRLCIRRLCIPLP